MKKKIVSALLCATMISSMLVGCGSSETAATTEETATEEAATEKTTEEAPAEEAAADDTASAEGGSVYYLNFKPEVDEAWQQIAADYTAATGVEVKVVTAASGTYEEVL